MHKPCVLRDGLHERIHTSPLQACCSESGKGKGDHVRSGRRGRHALRGGAEAPSRGAWRTRISGRRLLEDPKGTFEQELGTRLPEGVRIRVVEESAQTIYLVLPSASAVGEDEELSDQDLEAVAGGSDTWLQCGPVSANVMCTQGC